ENRKLDEAGDKAKTKRFCPESRREGGKKKPLSEQMPWRGQSRKRNATERKTSDDTKR
ncbi:hypothetical protein TNCV_2108911, partial [Trichonephila clavipes]